MSRPTPPPAAAAPALGLWDVVSIIVGIIIGSSIYQSPPLIFANVSGPAAGLAAWALGGVLALVGALCYAELANAYPSSGGDYDYLNRAFGRPLGFAFAWAQLSVIRAGGSIAIMACVFADYADGLLPLRQHLAGTAFADRPTLTYATLAIVGLAVVNALGLRPGKFTQNLLTAAKVLGLGGIIVVGFLWFLQPAPPHPVVPPRETNFWLAMVFVFYAYTGWNEAAFVASELRDRRRNIVLALVLGTAAVTVIYLAVNAAYLSALGFEGVATSRQGVAARVLALPLGERGAQAMSVLVMISALGAINGLLFSGARLNTAFGADYRLISWLGGDPEKPGRAVGALAAQVVFSVGLIALVEHANQWKSVVVEAAHRLRIPLNLGEDAYSPSAQDRFNELVICTGPVFYFFLFLTGLSLFVLRFRDPGRERPFRVPGYPVLPAVFCLSSLYMLYRTSDYALSKLPADVLVVAALLLLGVPLYVLARLLGPPPGRAADLPESLPQENQS
jgi:amino acid transporter